MTRTTAAFVLCCLLLLLLPNIAKADARGEKVIGLMDAALTAADDQVLEMDLVIQDPGNAPRRLGMVIHVRGTDRRHIHFVSPGDVKGMKLLIRSRTQMYVYLPAYRKVRRIASHVRAQTMFGADFNYDDMSTVVYAPVYKSKFLSETKTHWTVMATRRPGQPSPYGKIKFRIRKDIHLPDQVYYYNDKGKKIKTETRSEYSCQNKGKKKICGAALMHMIDHTRNNHWSKIERKSWKIDDGFSERIFSVRTLQRGR